MPRLPGRWRYGWCVKCKTYRCLDPVQGPVPTRRQLRSGWRRYL